MASTVQKIKSAVTGQQNDESSLITEVNTIQIISKMNHSSWLEECLALVNIQERN